MHRIKSLRLLGAAHIAVAVALLPAGLFLGYFSLMIAVPALFWLALLGRRLRQAHEGLRATLLRTHLVFAPLAVLLFVYGIYALRESLNNPEGGGGLLAAIGLIPIVMGFLIAVLSITSLWLCYQGVFKNTDME